MGAAGKNDCGVGPAADLLFSKRDTRRFVSICAEFPEKPPELVEKKGEMAFPGYRYRPGKADLDNLAEIARQPVRKPVTDVHLLCPAPTSLV